MQGTEHTVVLLVRSDFGGVFAGRQGLNCLVAHATQISLHTSNKYFKSIYLNRLQYEKLRNELLIFNTHLFFRKGMYMRTNENK